MEAVRVLIVDDSAFMRQSLKGMIETSDDLEVVATARSARDALIKLTRYRPDVVTLNIVLQGAETGLDVLEQIMTIRPTPTIMVSGASDEHAGIVLEAISRGAFDFIVKPSGDSETLDRIADVLRMKIRAAARSRPFRRMSRNEPTDSLSPELSDKMSLLSAAGRRSLIVIGSSTGGPRALQTVIPGLADVRSAPIVVVQHMPPKFTKILAGRLSRLSKLPVVEAADGERLRDGCVYVAPGGCHLLIRRHADHLIACLSNGPPVHGVRPSLDVTLKSLSELETCSFIVAILTGMGRDGAEGLALLKERNRHVYAIAESKESSIVFGMPKAAIETKKIDRVTSLQQIAQTICSRYRGR